ncbi:phosphotransferase family protein [Allocatelliglobosispora scoriae]
MDTARLADYLERACPGLVSGPLDAELIQGGRSNLTYTVTDTTTTWVVRRPPLGHVLTTAHDMAREFRVLSALAATAVPVPATIALCQDDEVLGAPFYVMERVEGTVFRTAAQAAPLGAARLHELSMSLVDVLVELHAIDPAAVGLADFGKQEGYLTRQLARWGKQLDASRSRDLPGIDELHDRLVAEQPESTRSGLVHGDYRLDNVIVAEDGRIAAVLDWEMATLGDQLTDVGLLLLYWQIMLDGGFRGDGGGAGFPDGKVLAARYAERTSTPIDRLPWYVAFACFKLAVIAEGIHYRYVAGQTVGAGFETFGPLVPQLVQRGHAMLATTREA